MTTKDKGLVETVAQALHANYLCSCAPGNHKTSASDLLDARTAIRVIKALGIEVSDG